MNDMDPRQKELEAQLRRLLGSFDASAGFDKRVMQRVATLATTGAPRADLRAQLERRRELVRWRLRREAWMNGITILGLGACAAALLWRFAPEIQQLAASAAWPVDRGLLAAGTLAAVGAAVWFLLKRMETTSR